MKPNYFNFMVIITLESTFIRLDPQNIRLLAGFAQPPRDGQRPRHHVECSLEIQLGTVWTLDRVSSQQSCLIQEIRKKIPVGSEISCFQIVSTLILSGEKQPVCQQKKYPQITIRCEQTCSFNWRAYFFSLIKEKWGKSNDRVREKLLVFIGQMGRDAKQVKISIVTRCDVKKFNGPFNQKCFFSA